MFPILRQQSYAVDSCYTGDCDYVGYVLEVDVVVGFDEGYALHANGEDVGQALAQVIPGDGFFVDFYFDVYTGMIVARMIGARMIDVGMLVAGLCMGHPDYDCRLRGRNVIRHLRRWLRDFGLQPGWTLLDYYHHEDDDEDEQNVNQRSDVHLRSIWVTA